MESTDDLRVILPPPINVNEVVKFFAENFYDNVIKLCSINSSFNIVLEEKGAFEIIEKSVSKLLIKKPDVMEAVQEDKEGMKKYFLGFVKNVLRNYTRDKTIKYLISTSSKTVDITKVNETRIVEGINSPSKNAGNAKNGQVETLFELTDKLYTNLNCGNTDKYENLIRYYRKEMACIKDNHIRLIYETNLHLFNAEYFFDSGKLYLSKKHALKSIELYNKCDSVFGHQFIANAYNLLGLVELNQRAYSDGGKTFDYNISKLDNTCKHDASNLNQFILAKSRMLYGMFSGNIESIPGNSVLKDSLEIDLPKSETIFKAYIKAYLLMDRNRISEAQQILGEIAKLPRNYENSSVLSKIRLNVAISESLTLGFTAKMNINREEILFYINKAEVENQSVGNKYFESMIKVIKGFALNDTNMTGYGLNSLRKLGYSHYSDWYKKKIFG